MKFEIKNNRAHESSYSDYAVRTGFFTCKGLTTTPLYSLTLTHSDPGRKTKNYNTELDKKNPFHKCHAGMRDKINSCHVKWYKPDTKTCHASLLHMRARSAVRVYTMAKKRKAEDKEADLLCCALLRGISCFDSK